MLISQLWEWGGGVSPPRPALSSPWATIVKEGLHNHGGMELHYNPRTISGHVTMAPEDVQPGTDRWKEMGCLWLYRSGQIAQWHLYFLPGIRGYQGSNSRPISLAYGQSNGAPKTLNPGA